MVTVRGELSKVMPSAQKTENENYFHLFFVFLATWMLRKKKCYFLLKSLQLV
jgi:hypothetical protein